MNILSILLGSCLMGIGVMGIVSNWWAVLDFIKVVIPLAVLIFGVLSISTGLLSRKETSK